MLGGNGNTFMQKMEKNKSIDLTEDIEALTIHGLSKATTAKSRITRFTWIILFACSFTALSYTAINSFIKYLSFQVIVKTEKKLESPIHLPAITFCHTNYYNPKMYLEEAPLFQNLPESCAPKNARHFKNEINKLYFYLACSIFLGSFNVNTSAMKVEDPDYFKFPQKFSFVPHLYPCFTLNRNSSLLQYSPGEQFGLNMILYDKPLTEKEFMYPVLQPLNDKRQGISVFIHDPKQHVTFTGGVLLPPGFHTHIGIKKITNKRLPSPYPSNCIAESEQDPETIFSGKNTVALCWRSCIFKKIYEECHAVHIEMRAFMKPPKYPDTATANYDDPNPWKCIKKKFKDIDVERNCSHCKPLCDEELYSIHANRNPWPQQGQESSLSYLIKRITDGSNTNEKETRQRLIKISIYYESMTKEVNEEQKMHDLSTIASDFGGQMGLFLGASLLSVAELFSVLVTYLTKKLTKRNVVQQFNDK